MKENKTKDKPHFPARFVEPIKKFLEMELMKLKKTQKGIKGADPFKDETRTLENSTEDDLDEQIGHFDSEVKAKFLSKRIVQMRKALTRIKLGKYGLCEVCGKMIDTERLAIHPEATTCVECQKKREA
jgi:RNA polymerase-binding transcription factor DksA